MSVKTALHADAMRVARRLGRSRRLTKVPTHKQARKLLEAELEAERQAALDAGAGKLVSHAEAFQAEQRAKRR